MGAHPRTYLAALSMLMITASVATSGFAAGGSAKVSSSRAMEARLEALERQNQMLEDQNRAIQGRLTSQKGEIDALKQAVAGNRAARRQPAAGDAEAEAGGGGCPTCADRSATRSRLPRRLVGIAI